MSLLPILSKRIFINVIQSAQMESIHKSHNFDFIKVIFIGGHQGFEFRY